MPTSTKDFPDPVKESPEGSKTGGASEAHLSPDLKRREQASAKSSLEAMLKGAGQEPQGAAATGQEMTVQDLKKFVQPCAAPSGTDAEGKPDQSLSEKQVERAATETLHALRPQPVGPVVASILDELNERGDDDQPKHKFKSAQEVIEAAKSALEKHREAEEKAAKDAKKAA